MKHRSKNSKVHTSRLAPKLIRTIMLSVILVFAIFFWIVAAKLFSESRSREIGNQRSQLAQAASQIVGYVSALKEKSK